LCVAKGCVSPILLRKQIQVSSLQSRIVTGFCLCAANKNDLGGLNSFPPQLGKGVTPGFKASTHIPISAGGIFQPRSKDLFMLPAANLIDDAISPLLLYPGAGQVFCDIERESSRIPRFHHAITGSLFLRYAGFLLRLAETESQCRLTTHTCSLTSLPRPVYSKAIT